MHTHRVAVSSKRFWISVMTYIARTVNYFGVRIRFKYNCLSNQTACQFKYLRSGVRITSKKTVCDKITLGGIFRQRPAKFPMSQCCSVGCMTYLIMSMCIVKLCHSQANPGVISCLIFKPSPKKKHICMPLRFTFEPQLAELSSFPPLGGEFR